MRLARTFLEVSDAHVLLTRRWSGPAGSDEAAEVDRLVWAPSRAIFQRGIDGRHVPTWARSLRS